MLIGPKQRVWPQILAGWLMVLVVLFVGGFLLTKDDYRPTPSVWEGAVWHNESLNMSLDLPDGWVKAETAEQLMSAENVELFWATMPEDGLTAQISVMKTDYRPNAKAEADAFVASSSVEFGRQMELEQRETVAGKLFERVHIIMPKSQTEQYFLMRTDDHYIIMLVLTGPIDSNLLPMLEQFKIYKT